MSKIILSKYGGSSVADFSSLNRIKEITEDDDGRRIIVVSAPGKRNKEDIKVTNLLVKLARTRDSEVLERVMERYNGLAPGRDNTDLRRELERRVSRTDLGSGAYLDSLKAFGEEACARVVAEVLDAEYVDPRELFILSSDYGNARILRGSVGKTRKTLRKRLDRRVVIPGFFGYDQQGNLVTLDWGGSDLTGGVISGALKVKVYENFTDSAILAADPEIVDNPRVIEELIYQEARDLSFSGFNILHHQAMLPVEAVGVPIHVRSTKDYPEQGTMIQAEREIDPNKPIVGVAYKNGFYYASVEKPGLDDMLGVLHKLSGILTRERIQILDAIGAIDDLCFIFHSDYIKGQEQLDRLKEKFYRVLGKKDTSISIQDNLGVLAVAGVGLVGRKGLLGQVADTLGEAGVNILSVSQGVKERCILYGLDGSKGREAVRAVYNRFLS